uniref:Uncharacterized protein n=1 Tax=Arion vulgaris TaxID=1028688 RepID=A0A0B6YAE5_9EUPU
MAKTVTNSWDRRGTMSINGVLCIWPEKHNQLSLHLELVIKDHVDLEGKSKNIIFPRDSL